MRILFNVAILSPSNACLIGDGHMKKVCGRLSSCLLLVLLGMGCNGAKSEDKRASKDLAPIQIVISKEQANSQEMEEQARGEDVKGAEGGECSNDSDCIAIPSPIDACLPCFDQSGQEAVSKATVKSVMAQVKEKCQPFVKEVQEGKRKAAKSSHESCTQNKGPKCVEGQCTIATLTDAEVKARMPAQPQGQGQAPQGQPQGSMEQMGTMPQAGFGGNYPIEARNGTSRFDAGNFSGNQIPANFGAGSTGSPAGFRFGGSQGQPQLPGVPEGYGRPTTFPAYNEAQSFPGFGNR